MGIMDVLNRIAERDPGSWQSETVRVVDLSQESKGGDLAPIKGKIIEEVRGENGELEATRAWSDFLRAQVWVVVNPEFESSMDSGIDRPGGLAWYYAEELRLLRYKDRKGLEAIQMVKLAFSGCRVRK